MPHLIQTERLTKRYGSRPALRDVTFTAETGEIIALIGENGAGKSTLMNMLTGYLAPTSGRALLQGHDVQEDALAARRCVGYLPEVPPLYPDLTVREYLTYCLRLKGLRDRSEVERQRGGLARGVAAGRAG